VTAAAVDAAAAVVAVAVVVVAAAVVAAAVGSVGRRGWLDFVVFFGVDAVALEVLWDPYLPSAGW